MVRYGTAQCGLVLYCAVQHSTEGHGAAQKGTAQKSAAHRRVQARGTLHNSRFQIGSCGLGPCWLTLPLGLCEVQGCS